jgi:hypothetical protein
MRAADRSLGVASRFIRLQSIRQRPRGIFTHTSFFTGVPHPW